MSDDIDRLVDRNQIKLLLAIVEARSFSAAAAALGVSQPSVSQQVKRIETIAGRSLFRRTHAGVELTADGEAVVIYGRAMLGLADDLRRHLAQTSGTVRISVGMAEDFCRTALPAILWLFAREHTYAELRVVSGSYDTLTAAIQSREVDLAVMRRYPALAGLTTPLWTDRLCWVGRPDLVMPIVDPVPLVLPAAHNPTRDVIIDTLRAHRRTWRVPFEGFSIASIEAAMQAGLGVCAGPRSMRLFGGVDHLDAHCGLPPLPDVEFVMVEPSPSAPAAVLAFAEVLRHAATSSFRRPFED